MLRAGVIGLVVLGAVPASAAAALPVVDPVSVRGSTNLPSGGERTLVLTCPEPAVALHAGASVEPGSDSVPGSNARRWSFRFVSDAGDPARRVRAVLRCVRLQLPAGVSGVRLTVGTVRGPDEFVVAGASRRIALTCQRGMIPTGWGIERGASGQALAVAAANPTRRGFVFRLENTGRVGASATARIRCLKRSQRAQSGERHAFTTRVARFDDSGPGARHACRGSEYSLSTGVSLDPADHILLTRAMPAGARGGRWSFNGSGEASTSLVCLDRTSRFRAEGPGFDT
jgi:hypothetical protein